MLSVMTETNHFTKAKAGLFYYRINNEAFKLTECEYHRDKILQTGREKMSWKPHTGRKALGVKLKLCVLLITHVCKGA